MCGRYQLQVSANALASSFPNTSWRSGHNVLHTPRQQLRPTTQAPVILWTRRHPSAHREHQNGHLYEIIMMKWGIIPSWSARLPQRPPIINARRETLLELPTFRVPLCHRSGSRRCVVPTTGFYEWHKSPAPANSKPTLTPYLVRKDKGPHHDFSASKSPDQANVVFMAGIYDSVHTSVEDQEVDAYQFVIVTTEASKQFQWLHDRQPVFLSTPQQVALWLNAAIPAQQAISVLNTESRLSWTRMLSDLSQPATGKTMLQRGLDNFMASGGQKKSGEEHLHSAHANDNLQGRPESLATPIRKSGKKKKPAQKDVGQKKITAFFTKRPAPH